MEENKVMNEEIQEMGNVVEHDRFDMVESTDSDLCTETENGSGALKVLGVLGGAAAVGAGLYFGVKKLSKKMIRKYVERHVDEFNDIYYAEDGSRHESYDQEQPDIITVEPDESEEE